MSRPRVIHDGIPIKQSRTGRIRCALLLPIDCRWNAWVRHYTAEIERLWFNLRGGEKRLYRELGID